MVLVLDPSPSPIDILNLFNLDFIAQCVSPQTHSNLFTIKHGLSESGQFAYSWNPFLFWKVCFCEAIDAYVLDAALGFKARVDSFACVLPWLFATDSSESPLVPRLLTSWQQALQPSIFDPHACISGTQLRICAYLHKMFNISPLVCLRIFWRSWIQR